VHVFTAGDKPGRAVQCVPGAFVSLMSLHAHLNEVI